MPLEKSPCCSRKKSGRAASSAICWLENICSLISSLFSGRLTRKHIDAPAVFSAKRFDHEETSGRARPQDSFRASIYRLARSSPSSFAVAASGGFTSSGHASTWGRTTVRENRIRWRRERTVPSPNRSTSSTRGSCPCYRTRIIDPHSSRP